MCRRRGGRGEGNTDSLSLILPTSLEALRYVVIRAIGAKRFAAGYLLDSSIQVRGERWSDSVNMNNKALKLGGHAELMHNSSGKLINSLSYAHCNYWEHAESSAFFSLPPPLPSPGSAWRSLQRPVRSRLPPGARRGQSGL